MLLVSRPALVLIPVALALSACGASLPIRHEAEAGQAAQERYAKAKVLFEERCKTAGVIVKRMVNDVEGIELTKLRKEIRWGGKEYFDPMYPGAAMATEQKGDDYIKQFLMSEFRWVSQPNRRGALAPHTYKPPQPAEPPKKGYRFVEYVDANGTRQRCVPTWREGDTGWVAEQHRCDPVGFSSARFALDYEDLVDLNDRALWIAGTKLKVVDRGTGEVIAELTRFVWDRGFGSGSTGRWPWQSAGSYLASACPSDPSQPLHNDSRYFIDTILVPEQGD